MPRVYKDGWHTMCGYDVYIEDGLVVRATCGEGVRYHVVYPYQYMQGWHCWTNVSRMVRAETFRRGLYSGRYCFQ